MYEGINVSDVGTLAGIRGIGYGGGYGGYGRAHDYGAESAIRADVVANRDLQQVDQINRSSENRFLSSQMDRGNQFLTDRINAQSIDFRFADVSRNFQDQNRQIFTFQLDQQRANADLAKGIAENQCCCERLEQRVQSLQDLSAKDLQIQTLQLQLDRCLTPISNRPGNSGN